MFKHYIQKAREDFIKAQRNLSVYRMNNQLIEEVKLYTGDLIKWNDGTLLTSVNVKNNSANMNMLQKEDGTLLTSQVDIEKEILDFYGNLMGREDDELNSIDVRAMRSGPQLNRVQRDALISPVKEEEIFYSLKGINDMTAPGLDGFNSIFFKCS